MRRSRFGPGGKVFITVIRDFGRSLGSLLGLGLGFLEIVCDLVLRKFLPATAWQAFQQQPTNAGTGQSLDFVADHVEHETDLAFETLLQDDVQDIGVLHPDTLGFGVTLFGHHAVEQLDQVILVEFGLQADLIFLLHALAGVHESMREISLIGQEQ